MRKLTIIFFSLLLMATESHAVSDSLLLDNMAMDLQIRQKPGTEKQLTEYLRNLPADCDTVYAIIYRPSQCPRCESCIHADYAALKRVRPDAKMALITVFPDSARASVYNHDNKYDADLYLYDTDGEYLNIFSFNSEAMIGTYILKMCRSTGRLLFGAETFYMGNDDFMRELTAWSGPMPMHDFSAKAGKGNVIAAKPVMPECAAISGRYCDYTVDTCGALPSQIYDDISKYDGNYLYFNDNLSNCVMLFRNEGSTLRLISKVEPDSTEKDRFIEVDEPLKSRIGDVYYIPLDAVMPDSSRLCVSYSLPNIFPDTIMNNGGLAYFNKAVVISRDISSGKSLPMYVPDFDMADTTFFYKHFKFCIFKGEVVFACQKLTWPMDYEREEYENKPHMNPFCEDFYSDDSPWIATFSLRTGKLTGYFSDLEPCAKAGFTGYYFVEPLMYSNGKELLYTDGYSGTIHITDDLRGGKEQTFSAFAVDTAAFPRLDTAKFYTPEYANDYMRYYYRRIIAARMDSENVYCIVKYMPNGVSMPFIKDNGYTFVVIDRRTGLAKESQLPHIGRWQTLGFGLRSASGHVTPFGLYHCDDGSYVVREWLDAYE